MPTGSPRWVSANRPPVEPRGNHPYPRNLSGATGTKKCCDIRHIADHIFQMVHRPWKRRMGKHAWIQPRDAKKYCPSRHDGPRKKKMPAGSVQSVLNCSRTKKPQKRPVLGQRLERGDNAGGLGISRGCIRSINKGPRNFWVMGVGEQGRQRGGDGRKG